MPFIDNEKQEINCKIVYFGPALGGKTTNIQYIYDTLPSQLRSDLISQATDADRLLYCTILPENIEPINGFRVRFHLYTVPGAVFYSSTKLFILKNVDGIIFVADRQKERIDSNIENLFNLKNYLSIYGFEFDKIPYVLQLNKSDLPTAMSVDELKKELMQKGEPVFEAVAFKGIGVYEALDALAQQIVDILKNGKNAYFQPVSTEQLLQILTSNKSYLWRLGALYRLQDSEINDNVVNALINALKDSYFQVRCEAAAILTKIGDRRAVAPLIEALKDENDSVRAKAANSLINLIGKESFYPLIELLKDENKDIGISAVIALGELGDERAVAPIIDLLGDPTPIMRKAAVMSLYKLTGNASLSLFIKTLTDTDSFVRGEAVKILGSTKSAAAVEPLLRMLKDKDENVQFEAIKALGKLADNRAYHPLLSALIFKMKRKYEIIEAIGNLGDPRALPLLEKIASGKPSLVEKLIYFFLPQNPFMGIEDYLNKKAAIRAIAQINKMNFR